MSFDEEHERTRLGQPLGTRVLLVVTDPFYVIYVICEALLYLKQPLVGTHRELKGHVLKVQRHGPLLLTGTRA